jgi:hypothetical protein
MQPKKFGIVGTILGTIALVIVVAGFIAYYVFVKPTVKNAHRRHGETCTLDIQCASDHCHHLTCE